MSVQQPRDDAVAIILAGGKSSRMGRPKATLPFGDEPLISHLVRELKTLFNSVVVVAAPAQELPSMPARLAHDEISHKGPVAGIYYGLREAAVLSFVTSCDAPFLNLSLISHLLSQAEDYDVVVPYWEERLQPLHAVYRPTVLPFLKEQLARDELRPIFLYDKVRTRKVLEEEIRRFDPEGLSFLNMNTPDDYEAALRRWREIRQKKEDGEAPSSRLTCTVELFGVARLLAKTSSVSLSLPGDATLAHLFSELAVRLPMLVGQVINSETHALTSGHSCNLNGKTFVRDSGIRINQGDNVYILSADAGG